MPSTKRYYTLSEIATLLHVPEYQARRWVRLFLALPPHKMYRIPAESLPLLQKVRTGVYVHRLRGQELRAFVEGKTNLPTAVDYPTLLRTLLAEIEACLKELGDPPLKEP